MTATTAIQPFNLRSVALPVNPHEWPVIDQEVARTLRPRNGIFTVAQDQTLQKLARSRWFILQNRGPKGYAYRCTRCKRIHDYFTLHCIERPMNGMTSVIGLMRERMDEETIWSAVELGAVVPIDAARAKRLFVQLHGLGYTAQDLLGSSIALTARYNRQELRHILG